MPASHPPTGYNAARPSTRLPEPPPDDLARSHALIAQIARDIAADGGWWPFARFMEACLYTPALGYYSGPGGKLGSSPADGSDFVTAPELGNLFGRALARQVAQVLRAGGKDILELGAGTGKLAGDVLGELGRMDDPTCLPGRYAILDLSGDLRARQQERLRAMVPQWFDRVVWLDRLPERIDGVVLANEVLDAMPVHLMVWQQDGWHERGVALQKANARTASDPGLPDEMPPAFTFADRPAAAEFCAAMEARLGPAPELPEGYLTELNLAAPGLIGSLAERLERGLLLFIDYGFPAAEFFHPQRLRGTLMAHYRHLAHEDVLRWPGLQDLTAHVDFTALAQAGFDAGLEVLGYLNQASLLINCGIAELIEGTPDQPARWLPQVNGLQRLTSEAEMGELFKAIALGKGIDPRLIGFARSDRLHTL